MSAEGACSCAAVVLRACCGCHRISAGVVVETLRPGDGTNFPKQGDQLTMHYTGTLAADGAKWHLASATRREELTRSYSRFDSSRDRDSPFQFRIGVGQVRILRARVCITDTEA